jgi:hypothetical protein
MKELMNLLGETLFEQKVFGIEFRKKYDVDKDNSKVKALRKAWKSSKFNLLLFYLLKKLLTIIIWRTALKN